MNSFAFLSLDRLLTFTLWQSSSPPLSPQTAAFSAQRPTASSLPVDPSLLRRLSLHLLLVRAVSEQDEF